MSNLFIASAALLAIAASSLAFGLRYLFAREYLFYHAQLTGLAWGDIPSHYQAIILGMLKMVGAGLLAFGLALAWLVLPFSRGESWSFWAILSLVSVHGFISIYVTIVLRKINPSAQTNVFASFVGVAVAMTALVIGQF
ncbi:hypothetical protein [Undibacterium rugosum]|uniref:hypothetical protein n=1 Tax=Undibacterium rugosum TaxID=2762291 RepID=UPI001B8446EA|nr:hypothetical protein [Undibacterium rugosum]MBR7777122.1 hypothetical protein [Undibacterium rugosum]